MIQLATIRGNTEEINTLVNQRQEWRHRQTVMENLLAEKEQQITKVTSSSVSHMNKRNPIVPKDLPAFQLRGHHRQDKNKDSYDSAESFLDDFEVHLAAYELDIEDNWRRLIPMTCDANRRSWMLSTIRRLSSTGKRFLERWSPVTMVTSLWIKIEPVIQMVLSLAARDSASDNNESSSATSRSDSESGDERPNKHRKVNKKLKKGKSCAIKYTCVIHPRAKHTRWECEKLKELLRVSRGQGYNNSISSGNPKFGRPGPSKENSFGFDPSVGNSRGVGSSGTYNTNWYRYCRHVPYVRGHEYPEMIRSCYLPRSKHDMEIVCGTTRVLIQLKVGCLVSMMLLIQK
ncbi:hypothetical protein INT45_001711 [Circinella minor]|uniref:Uncharacterized protein n=1 Tax=Circinella minor TaxID=1195481 RepID=A0A8H7S610_9FUNG|nr:hypothetical protein INT45_001711 [Circinella minor]